jgi:hypothetical protein
MKWLHPALVSAADTDIKREIGDGDELAGYPRYRVDKALSAGIKVQVGR